MAETSTYNHYWRFLEKIPKNLSFSPGTYSIVGERFKSWIALSNASAIFAT